MLNYVLGMTKDRSNMNTLPNLFISRLGLCQGFFFLSFLSFFFFCRKGPRQWATQWMTVLSQITLALQIPMMAGFDHGAFGTTANNFTSLVSWLLLGIFNLDQVLDVCFKSQISITYYILSRTFLYLIY